MIAEPSMLRVIGVTPAPLPATVGGYALMLEMVGNIMQHQCNGMHHWNAWKSKKKEREYVKMSYMKCSNVDLLAACNIEKYSEIFCG